MTGQRHQPGHARSSVGGVGEDNQDLTGRLTRSTRVAAWPRGACTLACRQAGPRRLAQVAATVMVRSRWGHPAWRCRARRPVAQPGGPDHDVEGRCWRARCRQPGRRLGGRLAGWLAAEHGCLHVNTGAVRGQDACASSTGRRPARRTGASARGQRTAQAIRALGVIGCAQRTRRGAGMLRGCLPVETVCGAKLDHLACMASYGAACPARAFAQPGRAHHAPGQAGSGRESPSTGRGEVGRR